MPRYSTERKQAVIAKMLPPLNKTAAELHRSEGISLQTLYNWRNEAKIKGNPVPGKVSIAEDWSGEAKFAAVLETASLTELELGEYCRSKGLYVEQLKLWKQEFLAGFSNQAVQSKSEQARLKQTEKELKKVRSELNRKEKALAEAAALLVLQKKTQALWEDGED